MVLRLLFDECVDARLGARLRAADHDVALIQEVETGADDERVIELARQTGRILVTVDKDFSEFVFRRGEELPGLVLLRNERDPLDARVERLLHVLGRYADQLLGRHAVVQSEKIRLRPLLTRAR